MNGNGDRLERRLRDLAAQAELAPLPSGPAVRAASDRRRRRRLGASVLFAIVIVGAVSTAALWPKGSSTVVPASKARTVTTAPALRTTTVPSPTTPTTTTPTTTVPTTTVPPANITTATVAALDAFVAEQASAASSAASSAGQSGPAVSVHSSPVDDRGTIVAVAAFSYSATGKPVEVLSNHGGGWSIVAAIGADLGPPLQPLGNTHLLALDIGLPVSVADVTGDGRPDFLIPLQAASTTPGLVVSQDGGSWRFIPNTGPFPTSDVVSGNPQFQGGRLVSTYDNCDPDCASGHNEAITWTYQPSKGAFWAPDPPGLIPSSGAANGT
ncbi:MAG: hypothetical protein ABSF33_19290 [Acidimicrobiales bacterium]|jgi:hypothetical protein